MLAALATFAVVVACFVGAYAHAAGHQLPYAEHAGHHHASGPTDYDAPVIKAAIAKSAPCDTGHVGHSPDCDEKGHSLADCHDIICHGGQAILAGDTLVPHVLHILPAIEPAAAFDGTEPGSLDRPPKALRSA